MKIEPGPPAHVLRQVAAIMVELRAKRQLSAAHALRVAGMTHSADNIAVANVRALPSLLADIRARCHHALDIIDGERHIRMLRALDAIALVWATLPKEET